MIFNSNHQTPLHIASESNRLSIVKKLYQLTKTSLLEIKDIYGQTPLSVTTNLDIIDELIKYGADISSIDNNDMNVIMIAVLNNHISLVNHLLSSINIFDQVENQNNRSLFLIAVQTGSIDMCSLLLTHRSIQWNTIDRQHMNIFHIAAQNNYYELLQFLYNYISNLDTMNIKSYINAQNEDGKTPVYCACEYGHRECLEILLNYNADIFLANYFGQLPFDIAIQNGHSNCVDLLIKSFKECSQLILLRKQPPLIIACQYGFIDIVKILLRENIGIDFDQNPLEIAIKYRQIDIIHILLEHPYVEQWLMSVRNDEHQTLLRDIIRYIPECIEHVLDKMIIKSNETDLFGEKFERIIYQYKYIDDYFM